MSNTRNKILAAATIFVIGFLFIAAYGEQIGFTWGDVGIDDQTGKGTVTGIVPPDYEVKYSQFYFNGVQKDASGTSVSSATVRGFADWNMDGVIDWDKEIFRFTEASSVYTSNIEVPITDPLNGFEFTVWVQGIATNYLLVHESFQITGQRNSDGSAKPAADDLEFVYLDDSLTYDGLMGTTAWDDSTDYNATLNGAEKTASAVIKGGSTASRGITSQVWEQVAYQTYYGVSSDIPYYVKWDQVESNPSEFEDLMKCGTFYGMYTTLQDYDDSNIRGTSSPWDDKMSDQTNTFLALWEDLNFNDLFRYSSDSAAFEYFIQYAVNSQASWALAYGCLMIDVDMDDYLDADLPYTTAANVVGTAGIDWDVTVV